MAKEKKIHKRKKIGGKTQAAEEPAPKIEFEETKTESEEARDDPNIKGQGTRYSCLHSTVRKKAGTTYSPKYSPKH